MGGFGLVIEIPLVLGTARGIALVTRTEVPCTSVEGGSPTQTGIGENGATAALSGSPEVSPSPRPPAKAPGGALLVKAVSGTKSAPSATRELASTSGSRYVQSQAEVRDV